MQAEELKFYCPERPGWLASVSGFCAERGINLLEVHQFPDKEAGRFLTRLELDAASVQDERTKLRDDQAGFGQDGGRLAWARGLSCDFGDRVFVREGKTVVFRD